MGAERDGSGLAGERSRSLQWPSQIPDLRDSPDTRRSAYVRSLNRGREYFPPLLAAPAAACAVMLSELAVPSKWCGALAGDALAGLGGRSQRRLRMSEMVARPPFSRGLR